MKNHDDKKEVEEEDIVEKFLSLQVTNLEEHVKELDEKIEERLDLSNRVLNGLGNEALTFQKNIRRLRYNVFQDKVQNLISNFEVELAKIENQKNKEWLECFRDVSILKEKHQEMKKELNKERLKLKLLE